MRKAFLVLAGVGLALVVLLPGATAEAIEGGGYKIRLTCDTSSASGVSFNFTHNGTPLTGGGWLPPPSLDCEPGQWDQVDAVATSEWNDFTFQYKCPKTSDVKTLTVPAPTAQLGVPYDLDCESPGATVQVIGEVGGIAEIDPLAGTSGAESAVPADGSGWSAANYAALAAGLAAAAVALSAGAWYARRRWTR